MKKIKDTVAQVLYLFIMIIGRMGRRAVQEKHLILIKTDEIGDYILFRNLFHHIRTSARFREYRITLVAASAWRSLLEEYDATCFDHVLWLDKKKFKSDLKYRLNFLRTVRRTNASDVINCIYSRNLALDDGIAFVASGTRKIAMKGDNANRQWTGYNFDRWIYSEIIDAGDKTIFEAVRNTNFISHIIGAQITASTHITIKENFPDRIKDYFVIFLGAGNPERKWPISSFVELCRGIYSKYSLTAVVCGGPGDEQEADDFCKVYAFPSKNYAGATSLPQLMGILANARLLVCVDTGIVHMAAAVNCPTIALYSGKFYGRFGPYPKEIAPETYAVYPNFVDDMIAKKDPALYDTSIMQNNTICQIPASKVAKFIKLL